MPIKLGLGDLYPFVGLDNLNGDEVTILGNE